MRDMDGLIAFVEGRATMPFAWGRTKNDCISYGLGWVEAQTGVDLLEGSGLRWRSALGAKRVIDRLGGLERAIDGYLPRVEASMAQRGDVGLIRSEGATTFAGFTLVGIEGDTVVGPGLLGSERCLRTELVAAWSIEGVRR
jgi:hypothetical protein